MVHCFPLRFWFTAYGLLLFSFFLLFHEWSLLPDGKFHVQFFDVAQGDSTLITTTENQRILIDGGPDLSLLERLGETLPFFDRRIDLLVLTHPEADHITAFPEVLRRYDVSRVLFTGVNHKSSHADAFLHALDESDAEMMLADAFHDLDLGDDAVLDILWPRESMLGRTVKKQNNESIVMKLTWRDQSILFTGDIEEKTEDALLKAGTDLTADILKVAHHGSKTSSSTGFLLAVAPRLAIISVGRENTYGHPHPSVLARYDRIGIPVKRTDTDGTMDIVLQDGME